MIYDIHSIRTKSPEGIKPALRSDTNGMSFSQNHLNLKLAIQVVIDEGVKQARTRGEGIDLNVDREFEALVIKNQDWLLRFAKKFVRDHQAAEDIVQETLIRAFKAYDGYEERGRERQWLLAIARNTALSHIGKQSARREVNLYGSQAPKFNLEDVFLTAAPSAEDMALADELTCRVLEAIRSLPANQQSVVYYRYIHDFSVSQTAALTQQPAGSVKSKSHYALRKVRRNLSQYLIEGEFIVSCKEAYAYLFQYAQDAIVPDDRMKVARHLSVCDACDALAKSLRTLAKRIGPAENEEMRHYVIDIQVKEDKILSYFGISFPVEDHERLNALLQERNGMIPDNETWFSAGHDADIKHLAEFDNEGHRIHFEMFPNPDYPNNVRYKYRKMVRVYPQHTMSSVGLRKGSKFTSSAEDSSLMVGKMQNNLGSAAKSGLYLAIPGSAKNVRIKRGNGVIDAGKYQFAFSERYVAEDERIALECTYLKD